MPAPALTVRDIFDQALEISTPAERKIYLDQACSSEPEILAKVVALLRAYDEAGSQFLNVPNHSLDMTGPYNPGSDTPQTTDDSKQTVDNQPTTSVQSHFETSGEQIGPYKLMEKLGEGGMGTVFKAQQDKPIRRQVALKIIKAGMDSVHVIARFEAERQALTMMDHVNIARVFDAGTTEGEKGLPYFVMELIAGVPLNRFCSENSLTIRDRLMLFAAICQAVQHAHQKGIMHRDLKPSNILVTLQEGKPVAKIIDFGLAKATEQQVLVEQDLTQTGNIVGTWKYMSPEQADGGGQGIDTRTDIYSLGVILYELLTDTTPIEGSKRNIGLAEFLRKLKEEVPQRPSERVGGLGERLAKVAAERKADPAALPKLLRGELDWIALKALEKTRDLRYQTASAFADDVERYLKDEPVEACPPSRRYLVGKFVRRNRSFVITVSALVASLIMGVMVSSVGWVRADMAKEEEAKAKDLAVKDRDKAQQSEVREHKALIITWAGIRAQIHEGAMPGPKEKEILRRMINGLQQLVSSEPDSSFQQRATAAETEFYLASLNVLIDKKDDANAHFQKAIKLYEALAAEFPTVQEYRNELARCNFDVAHVLSELRKPADAEAAFRRSVDLFQTIVALFPNEPTYQSELAFAYNDLGVLLRDNKKLNDAEKAFREAVALGEKVRTEVPNNLLYQINLAASYGNLANTVRDQGDPKAALEWYGKTTALLKPITADTGKSNERLKANRILRNACWDRANARGQLGLHADASRDWQAALTLNAGAKPDDDYLRQFLVVSQMELKLDGKAKATAALLFEAATQNARAVLSAKLADENSLQNRYINRALDLLNQAKTAGWFNDPQTIKQLREDKSFDSLPKEEFQAFLASLMAEKKPKTQIEKK
jgi:serine/threonine protein kinase